MTEIAAIAVAVIILIVLIKIGLKIMKWGLILLLLYVLYRLLIHGSVWRFF